MSLHKVSTEIDDMIIGYLPASDILNFALTSKYYSQLALRRLSGPIHVYKHNAAALSKLVYKLVMQPKRTNQIHAVSFFEPFRRELPPDRRRTAMYDLSWPKKTL
jgi:hypothetical protein